MTVGNVQAMLDTLIPLHTSMERDNLTIQEKSFYKSYLDDLNLSYTNLQNYIRFMNEQGRPIPTEGAAPVAGNRMHDAPEYKYIVKAWDRYYSVFKLINQNLPQLTSLELEFTSPYLLNAKDLVLAIPGTYSVDGSLVRIQSFHPKVLVIRSKQRPRKIRIIGENGREFVFLLKVSVEACYVTVRVGIFLLVLVSWLQLFSLVVVVVFDSLSTVLFILTNTISFIITYLMLLLTMIF